MYLGFPIQIPPLLRVGGSGSEVLGTLEVSEPVHLFEDWNSKPRAKCVCYCCLEIFATCHTEPIVRQFPE